MDISSKIKNELIQVAVNSVQKHGDLALFWKYLHEQAKAGRKYFDRLDAKQFEAEYANEIYRRAQNGDIHVSASYEAASWGSGEARVDVFDNLPSLHIGLIVLEIPNYLSLMSPAPKSCQLVECEHAIRDNGVVLQPLFKMIAWYSRFAGQYFILGLDRHTREPFGLAVPNEFVRFPADVGLRWSMDVHKGDIVVEV